MKNSETILELRDVSKVYAKTSLFRKSKTQVIALNQISLKILKGEIFGLVGESGSGKTTVGRLIVGLETALQGSIFLDGTEVSRLKGRSLRQFRRKVQMIFQDPYQSLNPQRTVYDTVSEPLVIHKMGKADSRRAQVHQALHSAGLSPPEDFYYRYPHQLSGGQRQRVAIARAMVLNPEVVVADEPTSMLDASISAQIFNILKEMRSSLDVTLLFITHSLAAARYLCDRIGVVYKGNLMEVARAQDVIRSPKHPYTQALIDAIPKFGSIKDVRRYNTLLREARPSADTVGCPFFPRCKLARPDRCSTERPLLAETENSHRVACFYAEGGGSSNPEN